MSQIKIEINDTHDEKRFDAALAQTLEMVLATASYADEMISVRTENCFDRFVKTVKCGSADVLTFFSSSYDDGANYA